jgi:hypothetical protein
MHLDRAQHTVYDLFDAKIDLIYKCIANRVCFYWKNRSVHFKQECVNGGVKSP